MDFVDFNTLTIILLLQQMKRSLLFSIFYFCVAYLSAQRFEIPISKQSDKFSTAFITALNNAPTSFIKLKGKLLADLDTIHKQSKVYQCTLNIPGATASRYIEDSTFYLEYFLGEYSNLDEAVGAMNTLTNKLKTSLNNRAVLIQNKKGYDKVLRENKLGYVYQNGFFHYNTAVQLTTISNSKNIRLVLQIFYGRPVYYNWIIPNVPVGGFNFINYVKDTYKYFNEESKKSCQNDIPPYICKGKTKRNDTTFVNFYKDGFDGMTNAATDFDVTFSNLESGLGREYVYWSLPCRIPAIKQYAFVKYDDVDKPKRKTILLTLYNNKLTAAMDDKSKNDLEIDLSFVY